MITKYKHPLIAIFILSFLVYANTLNFEFVLDDKIVITENAFTKKGIAGIADIFSNDSMTGFFGTDKNLVSGGRYRPLSMAIHAVEWELFGDNPFWYHLFNVLFYALSACVLLLILFNLFPPQDPKNNYVGIAFLAAAFFAVNPLHTEVVANIKSRDEIMSIFFAFVAFYSMLKYAAGHHTKFFVLALLTFLLSLLSKESSVVFAVIIPMSIYYFKENVSLKKVGIIGASLFSSALAYIALRIAVIGSAKIEIAKELMNNPFLNANTSEKFATIFYTLAMYLKLLFYPHPLTHDYYPKQIPIVDWSNLIALTSIVLHLSLLGYALIGIKKRRLWSYLILLYMGGLALYSNILFPIGTFMNDRFLYVPTIASAILFALVLIRFIKNKTLVIALSCMILLAYSGKTITRNYAWENDTTLALTDISVSENSAKANMSAGLALIDRSETQKNTALKNKDLVEATKYLSKALEIYPTYLPPTLLMGNALVKLKKYDAAIDYYHRCLQMSPGHNFSLQNLEFVAQEAINENQFPVAARAYEIYIESSQNNADVYEKLGEVYGKNMGDPKKALPYLKKSFELDPQSPGKSQKLGIVYAMLGDVQSSIKTFETGLQYNPESGRLWLNLGITLQNAGDLERSKECFEKAFELEPELREEQ